jgi:hypothetical protein
MPSLKFKSQLLVSLLKNSFYSVNKFKEFFQNKDDAKTKNKKMFTCINALIVLWF